jgi:hypothetical protein
VVTFTSFGFTGTTGVDIGGVAQPFSVVSDNVLSVGPIDDATPVGIVHLGIATAAGPTAPLPVPVIHLVVSELDSDSPGTDMAEFVEIATGLPNADLTGYVLVLWNGSNDLSYLARNLTQADANGLLLAGNDTLEPDISIGASNILQNGQDAASIHQGSEAAFPLNTPVTALGIIDALVYDTSDADDPGLLSTLMVAGSPQVNESENTTPADDSLHRCGAARRDGSVFVVKAPPTPGAPNACE